MKRKDYEAAALEKLYIELVKLQEWVGEIRCNIINV